ncbi:MAG: hypothetical protein CIT03_02490 [Methanobacterium sp.]|nr:MAG: hypothetical protein CIT03_02490 [Methanobacterium sp.]
MVEHVEKKIGFFKLELKKDEKEVDPIDVFSYIKSLDIRKEERYLKIKEGQYYSMMFYEEDQDVFIPLKFIMGIGKKKDLPCLEEKGETEPLEIQDKSLFEPTHMILFNGNILGVESNYHGPRASGLKNYILKKAKNYVDYVEIVHITRPDFLETLRKMGEIKLFSLVIHKNHSEIFKDASKSIYHTLNTLSEIGNSDEVGVYLRSKKHIRGINWKKIFDVFKKKDVKHVKKAEIRARNTETNKLESFNLLDQYIVSTQTVVKHDARYKRVDPKSMFVAIKLSFKENQSEIRGITEKKIQKQKTLEKWTG